MNPFTANQEYNHVKSVSVGDKSLLKGMKGVFKNQDLLIWSTNTSNFNRLEVVGQVVGRASVTQLSDGWKFKLDNLASKGVI